MEITEMAEFVAEELHLVKTGANGFPELMAKSAAELVEDAKKTGLDAMAQNPDEAANDLDRAAKGLCGERDCEVCTPVVTQLVGTFQKSYGASDEQANVFKAKLTTQARNALDSGSFVFPKQRRYPIHDESHAKNALARVSQNGTPKEKKKVRNAVGRKFPGIAQAKKSPGVPDSATNVPARADALPQWPAQRHTHFEGPGKGFNDDGHDYKSMAEGGASLTREVSGYGAVVPDQSRVAQDGSLQPKGIGAASTAFISIKDPTDAQGRPFPGTMNAFQTTKGSYSHVQLERFRDMIRAQREGKAIKEPWLAGPNPDTNQKPGSPAWESYDSVTLKQVAEKLAECGKAIDAIKARELEESKTNPGDAADASDLYTAKDALDCALSIVARLSFVEGTEAAKADFALSQFSTQALSAARDQIEGVLAARPTNTSKETIDMELTKEQFDAAVKESAKAVTAEAIAPIVKENKQLRKAFKKLTKALAKANGNSPGSTSNNNGEVTSGDMQGKVTGKRTADDVAIPGSGVTKSDAVTATASPDTKVKKEKKGDKSLKKQVKETLALVQKMAAQPRSGGPHLTGTPAPGAVLAQEGRQGDTTVTKSARQKRIDELTEIQKGLVADWDKVGRHVPPSNYLIQVNTELNKLSLAEGHAQGDDYVPIPGTVAS